MMYKDDELPMYLLLIKPAFLCQTMMLLAVAGLLIAGYVVSDWPSFCYANRWAYFMQLGTAYSILIVEISSLLCWIIFEKFNWITYSLLYWSHGITLFVPALVFIFDYYRGCSPPNVFWPNDLPPKTEPTRKFSKSSLVVEIVFMSVAVIYILFGCMYGIFRAKL